MKKSIVVAIIVSIVLLSSLAGCASRSTSSDASFPGMAPPPAPMAPSDSSGLNIYETGKQSTGYTTTDRKIIKTGYMTMVVQSITDSLDNIAAVANELGGYVVSSNKNEGTRVTSGYITIRVPAPKYDEAISRLREIAIRVPSESTNTEDVTEEYIDLKARLSNLKATETQYLELLKKAGTVDEMLKVQQALSDVRGQIEQIEGRIQYLERTSDMSLINITLNEEQAFHENGWNPGEILKSAVRGLATFGKVLVNILIWVAVFIPLWAIIGVVVWLIIRRKKRAKTQ